MYCVDKNGSAVGYLDGNFSLGYDRVRVYHGGLDFAWGDNSTKSQTVDLSIKRMAFCFAADLLSFAAGVTSNPGELVRAAQQIGAARGVKIPDNAEVFMESAGYGNFYRAIWRAALVTEDMSEELFDFPQFTPI